MYETWQELKTTALSSDSIMSHFDRYYIMIHEAGADEREISKYPKFTSYLEGAYTFNLDFEVELRFIRSFTETRLQWLDRQVEELCR